MTPFDFANDISHTKKYLIKHERDEGEYNSFVVNRYFTLFPDTIFYANEINISNCIDKKMQHDYLFYSIRSKKRYSKWPWKKVNRDDYTLIQSIYKYSHRKTKAALNVVTDQQLQVLKKQQQQGG